MTTLAKYGSRYITKFHVLWATFLSGHTCFFGWDLSLFGNLTLFLLIQNETPKDSCSEKVICCSKRFSFPRAGLELTKKVWSEICIICSYSLTGRLEQFSPVSIQSIEKMPVETLPGWSLQWKSPLTQAKAKKGNCFKVFLRWHTFPNTLSSKKSLKIECVEHLYSKKKVG